MTGLQIYGFFISPFVALAAGVALYFVTGWLDRREREREQQREHHPAE